MSDTGERESLREVSLHHLAVFGSVFSNQEQVILSQVKHLPMPQNDLVSFGQNQPCKLFRFPLLMPVVRGLAIT